MKVLGMKASTVSIVIRAVITIALLIFTAWAISNVTSTLSALPVKDAQGNVVLDQYARANALLLVLLPLLTTILGHWFGSQGTARAEARMEKQSAKLEAVLDTAPENVMKLARDRYPEAFK